MDNLERLKLEIQMARLHEETRSGGQSPTVLDGHTAIALMQVVADTREAVSRIEQRLLEARQ